MKKIKCIVSITQIALTDIEPRECIGMLFKNKEGVFSQPNNLEDILKANAYFGAMPHHVYIREQESKRLLAATDPDLGVPVLSGRFIQYYLDNKPQDIDIEFDNEDMRILNETGNTVFVIPRPKLSLKEVLSILDDYDREFKLKTHAYTDIHAFKETVAQWFNKKYNTDF